MSDDMPRFPSCLKGMVHECSSDVRQCPQCQEFPTSGKYSDSFPWAVNLHCRKDCNHGWSICRLCYKLRKSIAMDKLQDRHDRRHPELVFPPHRIPVPSNVPEVNTTMEDNAYETEVEIDEEYIWLSTSKESNDYFANASNGDGASSLLSRSINDGNDKWYYKFLSCDVLLFWLLAKLLGCTLTLGQHTILASIFSQMEICRKAREQTKDVFNKDGNPTYWHFDPPHNENLF